MKLWRQLPSIASRPLSSSSFPHAQLPTGATENARPDIARPSKLWRLTSRDWTTRHHIARMDIARPDNPAPCPLRWFRISSVLRLDVEENDWTVGYVKVFQRVQQLVPQFAPTCAMADFEEALVAGFFLDNRLCQITVQTFSIIIATFPSANTYLCCWPCLLVNNIWIYDYMTVL